VEETVKRTADPGSYGRQPLKQGF